MKQLLSLKDGVKINLLDPSLNEKIFRLAHLWAAFFPLDEDGMTITSGYEGQPGDGVHQVDSLHYVRRAIDIRVRDVSSDDVFNKFIPAARLMLGKDYDVVWEKNHVHIEFDPKDPMPVA